MLPDPYGSDVDYDTLMGRPFFDRVEDERLPELDEQEHDWWCVTEPPAGDLLEVLHRKSAA